MAMFLFNSVCCGQIPVSFFCSYLLALWLIDATTEISQMNNNVTTNRTVFLGPFDWIILMVSLLEFNSIFSPASTKLSRWKWKITDTWVQDLNHLLAGWWLNHASFFSFWVVLNSIIFLLLCLSKVNKTVLRGGIILFPFTIFFWPSFHSTLLYITQCYL